MARNQRKVGQDKSAVVAELPVACCDEAAAVEFWEKHRWGDKPTCVHCNGENVYKMADANTGARNKRFLWRCRDCKRQYTVRINSVLEESRIPLRHWCYALWRACTSKKGVAALEIKRQTGLNYRSALFLMHRLREAMTDTAPTKLSGIVESDEVWVGGKATGRGSGNYRPNKLAVQALIQRGGPMHARVIGAEVNARNLRAAFDELVDRQNTTLMTDELLSYRLPGRGFKDHQTVNHTAKEYARGECHVNTAEAFFAVLRRGIHGIYHNVSKKHLHRYVSEFQFRFNGRRLEDGERVLAAVRGTVGKRLMYRQPVDRV